MRLRMSRIVRSLGNSSLGWPLAIKASRTSAADRFVYRRDDLQFRIRVGVRFHDRADVRRQLRVLVFAPLPAARGEVLQAAHSLMSSCSPFSTVSRPQPKRRSACRALPPHSSVTTSAWNKRRWYPVSRRAPERSKASIGLSAFHHSGPDRGETVTDQGARVIREDRIARF